MVKISKISNTSGYKRLKKPMLKTGDILTQDYGYTIKTKKQYSKIKDTLWKPLPKNYKLKGKVIRKRKSQYQGKVANELKVERLSKSPANKRMRKHYFVWQWKDGTLMK
ncbi:hypothetical protein LCGC14_2065860 [marine sediment metagenome]|uniref:Uncharacterized protein n=1 Tax=marine sediment metagenome TaxID=412755 RepID=A0A0F9HGW8_9ZZZZ